MDNLNDLKTTLLKLYGLWLLSDFIVWGISTLYVWITGSLVDLISELLVSLALGAIPFPFNILAIWQIDPLSIIFQTTVFFVIVIFLVLRNRE
jgi:hypothetical protein